MLAIELKLCWVVATVADFTERQRAGDVNQDEAKAASVRSRALPLGLRVSGSVLRRRPACLEVKRSGWIDDAVTVTVAEKVRRWKDEQ